MSQKKKIEFFPELLSNHPTTRNKKKCECLACEKMNSVCQFHQWRCPLKICTKKKPFCVYIFQCPVLSHQLLEWNPNGVAFFCVCVCVFARFGFYGFAKCHVQSVIFSGGVTSNERLCVRSVDAMRWVPFLGVLCTERLCCFPIPRFVFVFHLFMIPMVILLVSLFFFLSSANIQTLNLFTLHHSFLSIFNRIDWESKFTS